MVITSVMLTACQYSGLARPQKQPLAVNLVGAESMAQQAPDIRPTRLNATRAVILGSIPVPNPCYTLLADAQLSDRELTVSLVGLPSETACAQILASIAYELELDGLTEGAYELSVEYEYPGTGWDPMTFEFRLADRGG